MSEESLGRTIQLYLVDGVPTGLRIASIHGWTGQVLVASQSAFKSLLRRPEADRTGVYVLFGPDPELSGRTRAYIGEADVVAQRISQSANLRAFWETALAVTTSDDALTKGHVRYLEARMIELAGQSGRVVLDNGNAPSAEQKRLPESDRANMERFLSDLRVILPVVGLDMLRPATARITASDRPAETAAESQEVAFEIRHKSGIKAEAFELDGEFIVKEGSEALRDTGYSQLTYGPLKEALVQEGTLITHPSNSSRWLFSRDHSFSSPSAAAAVVLDRNSNGRIEWRVKGSKETYASWQTGEIPA